MRQFLAIAFLVSACCPGLSLNRQAHPTILVLL
jgi:hypothetical protein